MKKPRLVCTLVVAAAACLAAGAAWAYEGPVKVGESVAVYFETPHPTAPVKAGQLAWREVIGWPGASYIAVHFSKFDLAPGERVEIRTPDGSRSYTFTGEGKPGRGGNFWATHVPGDACEVILWGNGQRPGNGFAIDKFAHGFPLPPEVKDQEAAPEPEADPRSICGTDDSLWAKCYETSEPTIYQRGRAVARRLIGGEGACTGWLIGCNGHVITNNHCIGSQADASDTDFEFMAEGATCATSCASWLGCPGTVVASNSTLVQTSANEDYALVQLPTNPTGTYGYLQLRPAGAAIGERMYLLGHPAAWGKRFSVASTASQDPGGFSLVYSDNEASCWGTAPPPDLGYFADPQGGSSGSPVLAYSDHRVLGLPH